MDKEKLIKQLKRLKQYKDLPPEELEKIANQKIEAESLRTSFVGLEDTEVDKAILLYQKYITEHSFESLTEKELLINVVRDEMIKERIAKQIQEEHTTKSANSLNLIEGLRDLEEHILTQKEKLGMLKDKESETALELFNELKEKCLKYYEEHAAEFEVKCPHCQSLFNLILPPDKLDSVQNSWFLGTDLYNEEVMNLYHKKIINKEQAAKILGVHIVYIDKIYQEIYLKKNND